MGTFFPAVERPTPETIVSTQDITWEPITAGEIEKALKAAKRRTAPGEDELPPGLAATLAVFILHSV